MNRQTVIELMRRLGIRQPNRQSRPRLSPQEWRLSELAEQLGRSTTTLHLWRKRGWLAARWYEPERCWVVWADAAALERLQARCALSSAEINHHKWLEAQESHTTVASRFTTA